MSLIRMTYDEMARVSKDFAKQRQAILDVIKVMSDRGEFLSENWDGVSSQEFMQQLASCYMRMSKSPAMLEHMSQGLTKAAKRLNDGELAAQKMMQTTIVAD
jgi:WXG100 family type VII secretion target